MSYATEIKETLCEQTPQKLCCRKALMNGFLYTSAEVSEDGSILTYLSGQKITSFFIDLVRAAYHAEPTRTSRRGGGGAAIISFRATSAMKYIQDICDHSIPPVGGKCSECGAHFLRGVFLACAYPCEPARGFRLDLTPRFRADALAVYLESIGLAPHRSIRGTREVLYFRSEEQIADFFGRLSLMNVYFNLQNEYLKRELNNLTNRQNNCTIRNIKRTVESHEELMRELHRMKDQNQLSVLPDELKATAELCLEFEGYPLSQLAKLSVPPITKSGLNHRLQKIKEISENLNQLRN